MRATSAPEVTEAQVLLRYGAAVAITLAAGALRWVLKPVMGVAPPYITFYLAIVAAAAFGGFGPGMVATCLGALMGLGLMGFNPGEVRIGTAAEQVRLVLYAASGVAISLIAGKMHAAMRLAGREAARLREAGAQLQQANERLAQANGRLEEGDRRKDRFMALLAHELRNPIGPIKNSLHLMKLRPRDPRVADQAVTIISRQIEQMSRLVGDMLDVTRVRHDKLDLHRQRIDLSVVVERIVEDHRPLFAEHGIALHLNDGARPTWVFGDAGRLGQVLGNLLHNARKFTPAAGAVDVSVERVEDHAVLQVRDSGTGIAADLLPRIFEPFEQGQHLADRGPSGLGLGLALVRQLVELHGGSVQALSPGEGRGAEFVVTLPLDTAP
jgi:signal transduction histidine kinase